MPELHSATRDGGGGDGDGDGDGDGAAVGLRAVQRQRLTAGLYRLMSISWCSASPGAGEEV